MPVVLHSKERDALHAQVLAEFTLFSDLERPPASVRQACDLVLNQAYP